MNKVGFIGYGKFAELRHQCINKIEGVEVIGAYDPLIGGHQNTEIFRSLDDLIANIDAVFISVPPKLAPAYVNLALEKKLHVFCEKPAAVSLDDLMKIDRTHTENLSLVYGFNHRLHESIKVIKDKLDTRYLGNILWMRGRYGKEVGSDYKNTWRCDKELNGGGILIDQGIHMADLMSYLAGGFNNAQAVLSTSYLEIPEVEDNAFVTLYDTKKRISASIHSTITQWRYIFSLEIFCEKGSMILNGLRTQSGNYGDEILTIRPNSIYDSEIQTQEIRYDTNTSWQKEVQLFLEAVNGKTSRELACWQDAYQTTKLIDLIYRNAVWI